MRFGKSAIGNFVYILGILLFGEMAKPPEIRELGLVMRLCVDPPPQRIKYPVIKAQRWPDTR
jgi:hypothetical protein